MDGLTFGTLSIVERVAGLLAAVFGAEKRAALGPDFVRWISDGPHGQCRWYAAFDGTAPVAVYGMLPLLTMVGGRLVPGALCHNAGVVRDYRGRGVFTEIGRFALDDMRPFVALGVPNDAAIRGHLKCGWNPHCTLEMMSSGNGLAWREGPRFEEIGPAEVSWLASREGLHDGHALKVHRSREFWEWRLRKPGERYVMARTGSGGFVVWKHWGPRKQVLVASDTDAVRELGGRTDMIAVRGSVEHRALWDAGFNPAFKRELIVRTQMDMPYYRGGVRFEACDFDCVDWSVR